MKKKGLIISTVVMVVVLIASLTTATYAWFTVSNKTTISGFNVEVVSGNAVNIGMKKVYGFADTPTNDMFTYGSVNYTAGTDGVLGTGSKWNGDFDGLGATVTHDIVWGSQSKAVGALFETEANKLTITKDAYTTISAAANSTNAENENKQVYINAANQSDDPNRLTNVTAAKANKSGTADDVKSGDYVHMLLGVNPAKELDSNELVLVLDGSAYTGQNIGMLAAVHVAYRTRIGNTTSAWQEAEFFTGSGSSYNNSLDSYQDKFSPTQQTAYNTAFNATAPTTRAGVVTISGLSKSATAIDQIELIIYIDGTDEDCRDEAKGPSGEVKIFFNAVEKAVTPSATPTDAKYNSENKKITLTGAGNGTTVEYTIDGTNWKALGGTWSGTTFTSVVLNDISGDLTNVKVRQKAVGKGYSDGVAVTAA